MTGVIVFAIKAGNVVSASQYVTSVISFCERDCLNDTSKHEGSSFAQWQYSQRGGPVALDKYWF